MARMPLNNSGDDVPLVNQAGEIKHRVSYTAVAFD